MEDKSAPRPGCKCVVCKCCNDRKRVEDDLEANYQRYLDGDLVARPEKE